MLAQISSKSDLIGVAGLNQYSALLQNTSGGTASKLCPSILKSSPANREGAAKSVSPTILEGYPRSHIGGSSHRSQSSHFDLSNS